MTIHHFSPASFTTVLGPWSPVLHIADGDTVITTTIDAGGVDAAGRKQIEGPNPQTGPFYIEGAEVGDTLAVRLESLYPNRTTGWTRSIVATNVVDPVFVRELPLSERIHWSMDLAAGTARLVDPPARLAQWVLPLDPMVGCCGVAPEHGQAIAASTAATHGGNMDYRGYRSGVTAYFPVFVPGALFFIGDGHAVQGAGEIVGTGIETSFDVRFSVHVLKGKASAWPRGEDDQFIFTAGNARPLDQALQHATTEMLRWLGQDYGLDLKAASTVLGQCVEYEVGNIYDPAYTVVCKLAKRWLP